MHEHSQWEKHMEEEEEEVEERWRAIEGSYTLPAAVLLSAVHALEQ